MSFPLINPSHQWFDTSSAVLVGGTVEFRSPTTNDLIDTFPTADDADAQTNANDNPFTLDSRGGFTGIYLEDGVKYKIIWKDSGGGTVDTQDDVQTPEEITQVTIGTNLYPTTAAETAVGVTPTFFQFPPLNVKRYGALGDGTTDDFTAIDNARKVSDQAYFNGEPYIVFFPNVAGNTGRYMLGQKIVIDRNGTHWQGEMPVRRAKPVSIAFLASATDTTLIDCTAESPSFENISFEGFSTSDQATKLFELHPKTRLATSSEQSARGLDGVTLYNFEDVDAEFNNCNFQFSTAAVHTYGRGVYFDTCEFFDVIGEGRRK